jgi:DNA-directed RNA polymerase specialized sigma24 family protein
MGSGNLETVFRQWRLPIGRLAFVITRDESVADGIVQDAFLKLHTAWDHVDNPVGYLREAVVNGCCSRRRWVGVRRRVAVPPISAQASSPDVADDGLAVALQRLSEPHRVVHALRYFGDLTDAEIASTIGVRPPPASRRDVSLRWVGARRTPIHAGRRCPLRQHIPPVLAADGCKAVRVQSRCRRTGIRRLAAKRHRPARRRDNTLRPRQTRRRPLREPLCALLRTGRESVPSLIRSAEPAASAPTRTAQ